MSPQAQKIHDLALQCLHRHTHRSGAILYSGHQTLRQGEVYFMGLNPGGVSGTGPKLKEGIEASLTRTNNAYLVPWDNAHVDETGQGETPLQRRVQWLFAQLGLSLPHTLCTNLVFMQSQNDQGIQWQDAMDCWPVHEAMLSLVKPELILVYGNSGFSPYGFLHAQYGGEVKMKCSGHGSWNLKAFKTRIQDREVAVVGLPHLSRYDPTHPQRGPSVIDWIRCYRGESLS